jgi:hypothetical protein
MSDSEHNGSDPDDTALLASAYLDDEATPDERALVETSPETLDVVAGFENVRTVLGASAPSASLSERESHLATALDVWERISDPERAGEATPSDGVDAAAAAAVTTPRSDGRGNRTVRRKRPGAMTMPQWALGAAAALVMIAGVGAVVLGVLREDGADTSQLATEQVTEDPATEIDSLEADEATEVRGGNVGADAIPVETDLSGVAAEPGGLFEQEGGADAGADAATVSSDEAAADAPGSEQPAPAPEIPEIEIKSPEDLAVYGSLAVPALDAVPGEQRDVDFEQAPGTCDAALGLQERLEPVFYRGVEVGVGVDLQNSVVYAYNREDCSVVESVALPTDTREFDDVTPETQP